MRQIALDTETTGLSTKDGHRIIEIGCVELINRKLTGQTLQIYINPERKIDSGATRIHGITNADLRDKPIFTDIVAEFMDFVQGAELIIHNATFDMGFLNYELSLLLGGNSASAGKNLTQHTSGVIDTLKMARKRHPGQRNNLDALCKRYGIKNSHRKLHGALLDAEILADLYLAMTRGQESLDFMGTSAADTGENTTTAGAKLVIPRYTDKPLKVIKG